MLTKKNILQISGVGFIIATISLWLFSDGINTSNCSHEFSLGCAEVLITLLFAIFIPIFIFSVITYKLKEETFISWRNFTVGYLFIYLFLIVANPWMHADYSPFEKNTVFMTLVPLYFLISLILITYKSIKLRGKS